MNLVTWQLFITFPVLLHNDLLSKVCEFHILELMARSMCFGYNS